MSMTRLEQLDPCRDWAPDEARAARLDELVERLCAVEEPATRTAPRRRFSAPRTIALGAAVVALAAVAFGLPGAGSDARAALVSAAERTAAFTSGRVTWIETLDGPSYSLRTQNVIRYQEADSAVEYVSSGTLPSGPIDHTGGFRFVGGQAWARGDDGAWKKASFPPGAKVSEQDTFAGQIAAAGALADFVRSAPDVTRQAGNGATSYRTSATGNKIPGLLGSLWADAAGPVQLEVVVRDDGTVNRFTLTGVGRTLAVTFDDLGADQGITAP